MYIKIILVIILAISTNCAHSNKFPPLSVFTYNPTGDALKDIMPGDTVWIITSVNKAIASGGKVMILFGASRCNPCKPAKKFWDKHSTGEYLPIYYHIQKDENIFLTIPVLQTIKKEVGKLPMLVFFSNGKVESFFSSYYEVTFFALKWLYEKNNPP